MTSRLRTVAAVCLVLALLLGKHLYALQVQQGPELSQKARRNTVVIERTDAPRGRILDRAGHLLVANEPDFQLIAVPAELKLKKGQLAQLATEANKSPQDLQAKLAKAHKLGPLEPCVLARGLDNGQVARLMGLTRNQKGIAVRVKERRRYLDPPHASHIFGYVGEITADQLQSRRAKGFRMGDMLGQAGLEESYDDLLRGRKGVRHLSIDALGRTVRSSEIRPARPGYDVYLTLDWELQREAERALKSKLDELQTKNGDRSSGAVVVMEVETGRVLALAGLPQYDLRPFARGIKAREYDRLITDPAAPLVNRAYQASFSPGSTFKIINSSASLQEGLCTPGTTFFCGGSYAGANCFVTSGHGPINFENSLAQSCDVVYYMLGDRLGIGRLGAYCKQFGLGAPTGLDLPAETGGILPDPAWKRKWVEDEWYQGDTVNMSIGQGFLVVTPLQMAVATAAVANGGKVVRPHVVQKAVANGRVGFKDNTRPLRRVTVKPELLAAVRRGMRGAVLGGTGAACNSDKITVAGKTGTVESFPSPFNPTGRNHTWWVSFGPYEKPEIAVVVFVEKSGDFGGGVAAPVARQVYDFYAGRPR